MVAKVAVVVEVVVVMYDLTQVLWEVDQEEVEVVEVSPVLLHR